MVNPIAFTSAPENPLIRRFRWCALVFAAAAAGLGAVCLAAWLDGSMANRGMEVMTIKTNAALAMMLLGIALTIRVANAAGRMLRLLAFLCAGAALVIAFLTLCENLFDWNLGIDQLLAREAPGAIGVDRPNRMGTPSSFGFTMAALAVMLLDRRARGTPATQGLGLAVFLTGLMGIIGLLYQVREFHAIARVTAISWQATAGLLLLGLGIVFSRPAAGPLKLLTADDPGGRLARRLLPLSVLLPLGLGYFRLMGERFGFFDPATGTGLVILLFILVFSGMAFILGQGLSRGQAIRERSAEALRKSEQRFRSTFEHAGAGIAHVGLDGRWLRVNDRMSEITGYSGPELLAGQFQDITHPEDIPAQQRAMAALREGLIPKFNLEIRVIHRDGSIVWVSLTVVLQQPDHDPVYMIAVIQDITGRKRMENALRMSEARIRHMANAMPQLVWTADPDGSVDYCNDRLNEYHHVEKTPEGKLKWEMLLHPDDARPTVAAWRHAVSTGEAYQAEHRLRLSDGGYRWHLSRGVFVHDEQGNTTKIFGTATDIDEIKEAQETLRRTQYELKTIVENSPDIILRFDRDFRFLFVNSAFERITGTERETLVGRTGPEIGMDEAHFNQWKAAGGTVLHSGRATDFEFSLPGVFGPRHFWGQLIPEFDRGGTVATVMLIARDITQRKQDEERIRYISFHDSVTGLYNRAYFEEEIRRLDTARALPVSFIVGDVNNLKLVNDVFGHAEGDRLLRAIADILRQGCRETDIVARWGGDEFALILPETDEATAQAVCDRIREIAGETRGTAIPPSIALGAAAKHRPEGDIFRTLTWAEERMYEDKLARNAENREQVIGALLARVHAQGPDREAHLVRTRQLVRKFSEQLGPGRIDMRKMDEFILLHDIGKAAVPDEYLRKPGPLADTEWEAIKRHPEAGFRIVKNFAETAGISDEILCLRERWDGTGYPRGVGGDAIPLFSRMFAIVDSYDTMTRPRPYRPALSREEALREIRENAGKQFDPELSELFLARVA